MKHKQQPEQSEPGEHLTIRMSTRVFKLLVVIVLAVLAVNLGIDTVELASLVP